MFECGAVVFVLHEFFSDDFILLFQLSPLLWKPKGVYEAGCDNNILKLLESVVCFVTVLIDNVVEDTK